jgi:CRISPR-associated protein Cmr3
MEWQKWTFRFLDTCFFRGSTPFNAGEGGYTTVRSVFPPSMTTLQGAIRTSLALEQGWQPGNDMLWPHELGTPDEPGSLCFKGPYVLWEGKPLFDLPLNVLSRKTKTAEGTEKIEFATLKPGNIVDCDLGSVCLPDSNTALHGAKQGDDLFLTRKGLKYALEDSLTEHAEKESDVYVSGKKWHDEFRVGLEREDNKLLAVDGKLYSLVHIRPKDKLELAVLISGVPKEWKLTKKRMIAIGGEGRMAEAVLDDEGFDIIPSAVKFEPDIDGKLYFTVSLITPGYYKDPSVVIMNGPPGVPGKCVSACVGKIVQTGGWDLARNEPRALIPLLPKGSIWFYEADKTNQDVLSELHGKCLGEKSEYGFGQIAIGKWDRQSL